MSSPRRRPAAHASAPDVPAQRWQLLAPAPGVDPASGPVGERVSGRRADSARRPDSARRARQDAVRAVLAAGGPRVVYQPQLSLSRMALTGYEALARFPGARSSAAASSLVSPEASLAPAEAALAPSEASLAPSGARAGEMARGTNAWFALAHKYGLGDQLEAMALQRALEGRDQRPAGTTLAVNLSPAVLTSPFVIDTLPDDLTGIEIEVTEHESLPGHGRLRRELDQLRERGARIAIDDVGVAHSGLRRVMELAPDRIKLDRHLVSGVSSSTAKAALIRSVVDFAEQVGCDVCAEGVETLDDLEALAELDVGSAQGWAVGKPDTTFTEVDPAAVAMSQKSLRGLLTNPLPASGQFDSAIGVEHLLARLAAVTSLRQLARLICSYGGVLGADLLVLSMLTPDGAALRSLEGPFGLALGDPYRLNDYPVTARAMSTRTIAPIYLPVPGSAVSGSGAAGSAVAGPDDGWITGGDEPEWDVLKSVDMQSVLLIPVVSRDRPIGLLECYGETTSRWSRRQIRSARTVAAMLGPVLDVLISR